VGFGETEQKLKELIAGETRVLPPLVLKRATSVVAGQVVDAAGNGVAGVTMELNPRGENREQSVLTDDTDHFSFEVVEGRMVQVVGYTDAGGSVTPAPAKPGTKDLQLLWQPPANQPDPAANENSPGK
jgi:hypothetical protein